MMVFTGFASMWAAAHDRRSKFRRTFRRTSNRLAKLEKISRLAAEICNLLPKEHFVRQKRLAHKMELISLRQSWELAELNSARREISQLRTTLSKHLNTLRATIRSHRARIEQLRTSYRWDSEALTLRLQGELVEFRDAFRIAQKLGMVAQFELRETQRDTAETRMEQQIAAERKARLSIQANDDERKGSYRLSWRRRHEHARFRQRRSKRTLFSCA